MPMIYYSLSTLMLMGIKEVLLISTPEALHVFQGLFQDGSRFGMSIRYAEQPYPKGLADAFIVGRDFIEDDDCALVLGDNIFYGHRFPNLVKDVALPKEGASIFAYWVADPQRYGVVDLDDSGAAIRIEEKPMNPVSNWAVTGLYLYSNNVVEIAAQLKPSARGELEITDVNRTYLEAGTLNVEIMGRGYAWLDTGTHESLLQASHFVQTVEERQGLKIACLEEIALRMGFIELDQFMELAEDLVETEYGKYLRRIADEVSGKGDRFGSSF
jgi:glucose-1-phosphate thymidylyltransferase